MLYAELVPLCDTWLGHLMDAIRRRAGKTFFRIRSGQGARSPPGGVAQRLWRSRPVPIMPDVGKEVERDEEAGNHRLGSLRATHPPDGKKPEKRAAPSGGGGRGPLQQRITLAFPVWAYRKNPRRSGRRGRDLALHLRRGHIGGSLCPSAAGASAEGRKGMSAPTAEAALGMARRGRRS